jgi:glutaredoxin-related protein
MEIRQATLSDLEDLLRLQEKYHVSNLTEDEKLQKGFVTMRATVEQFTHLINNGGIFIARVDGNLAAYAFTSEWDYFRQWPIIQTMEAALPNLKYEGRDITVENSFQYGPVCIDETYRGRNILTMLFAAVQKAYQPRFEFAVTFINQVNVLSSHAHARKTPLSIIGTFDFNNNHYNALASPTVAADLSAEVNIIH